MSIRRFSVVYAVVLVIAAALLATLSMNAYPGRPASGGSGVHARVYYPLPPGKQNILVNAAKEACTRQDIGTRVIDQGVGSESYLPLPPGKQTALIQAARQTCIRNHVGGQTGD